ALAIKEPDAFFIRVQAMQQETERLLKRLRRYKPKEEKLLSFFYNADNFLSWHAEQVILKLLDKGPKSSEHAVERKQLLQFCEAENGYREQKRYNSVSTVDDPNRLANKMHLLQRLIEHGVVLRRETRNLNTLLRRFVKGSVTAIM
ncbi:hypothetical protein CWB99_24145, partial [Pseudoalteromonas rubra]